MADTVQTWSFHSAWSDCCYKGSAQLERKSIFLPGHLLDDEEAVDLYDSTSLGELEWGEHKGVTYNFGEESPVLEDSFPLQSGFYFEHETIDQFYGKAKAQVRYKITFPQGKWREMDGESIYVEFGQQGRHYEFDEEEGEYVLISEPDSVSIISEEIAVGVGAEFVYTSFSSEIVLSEGSLVTLFPSPGLISFTVSNGEGFWQSPPVSVPGAGFTTMGLAAFYSERRNDVEKEMKLRFSATAFDTNPVTISYVKTFRDLAGQLVSESEGIVTLTSTDPVEQVIPAPASDGRVYCHSFVTTATRFGALPIIRGTQVCVELPGPDA